MPRTYRSRALGCAFALAVAWLVLEARDVRACGGCFHPPPQPLEVDSSVVTDHRMAFSMSTAQTVLWDQIRYTGNPKDFAWVLPIRQGARIELSHDAWIASLAASTDTVITGPTPSCGGPAVSTGGGGGCAFGGMSSSDNAVAAGAQDAGGGNATVQVVSQQVVGPYQAVTVRSSQGEALGDWLRANGYEVPSSVQPMIDAYAGEGFDFIALKLAPNEGVQAMQPVRVVTPGADPTLPLRMVAAGIGAHVGLELYVLSEGRYHPANFPDATVDFTKLTWDPTQSRSNYAELAQQALSAGDSTGWLTESAQLVNLYGQSGTNLGLATIYQATCRPLIFTPPCSTGSAGASGSDGGAGDEAAAALDGNPSSEAALSPDGNLPDEAATTDANLSSEADAVGEGGEANQNDGDSAGIPDTGTAPTMAGPTPDGGNGVACMSTVTLCDDLSVAMTGIVPGSLWVTRLRADLPAGALVDDLVLEATASQSTVSNVHHTELYSIPNYDPCGGTANNASSSNSRSGGAVGCGCRSVGSPRFADAVWFSLGGLGLLLSLRRRRASSHRNSR